jgi:hypothetical protein
MAAATDRLARLRAGADRLGLTGVAGVGLMMFAAVWFFSAALPERARIAELERRVAALGHAVAPGDAAPAVRGGIEGQLDTFYGFFAVEAPVTAALARIHDAARGQGLAFDAAEYRVLREGALKLDRYELSVPLRGSYAQLRGFVTEILDALPQAAVDELALQRDSVGEAQLEARLRLSIYRTAR